MSQIPQPTVCKDPWNYMMDYAIPRASWDPNRDSCVLCNRVFDLINRQHHCRRCGKCVCAKCSPNNMVMAAGWKGSERVCIKCEASIIKVRNFIQSNSNTLVSSHEGFMTSEHFTMLLSDGTKVVTPLWLSDTYCLVLWKNKNDHIVGRLLSDFAGIEEGLSTPELDKLSTPSLFSCCFGDEKVAYLERSEKKIFSLITKTGESFSFVASSEKSKTNWVQRWKEAISILSPVVEYHVKEIPLYTKDLLNMEKQRMKPFLRTKSSKAETNAILSIERSHSHQNESTSPLLSPTNHI